MEDMRKIKSDLDVRIIGSDISLRAIETASNNMDHAEISRFADEGVLEPRLHKVINNPLVYSQHWPRPTKSLDRNEMINFGKKDAKTFLSLYSGDFESVGH